MHAMGLVESMRKETENGWKEEAWGLSDSERKREKGDRKWMEGGKRVAYNMGGSRKRKRKNLVFVVTRERRVSVFGESTRHNETEKREREGERECVCV